MALAQLKIYGHLEHILEDTENCAQAHTSWEVFLEPFGLPAHQLTSLAS